MLNNETRETNIGKLKNRICLRQLYQIKNGQKQYISSTFQNGPNTVWIYIWKEKQEWGAENKVSTVADRNET